MAQKAKANLRTWHRCVNQCAEIDRIALHVTQAIEHRGDVRERTVEPGGAPGEAPGQPDRDSEGGGEGHAGIYGAGREKNKRVGGPRRGPAPAPAPPLQTGDARKRPGQGLDWEICERLARRLH